MRPVINLSDVKCWENFWADLFGIDVEQESNRQLASLYALSLYLTDRIGSILEYRGQVQFTEHGPVVPMIRPDGLIWPAGKICHLQEDHV